MYVDSPPLPEALQAEPWSPAAARWRLERLRDELPVPLPADPTFVGGNSNDAWLLDDAVLRVCWRADRDRLLREAALVQALPSGIPHAPVVASGRNAEVSWLLSARMPGRPFDEVATELPRGRLRELFAEFAGILAALHDWKAPPEVVARVGRRPEMSPSDPMSVWAADLIPLPVPRALALLPLARGLDHVDPALIDATADRIRSLSAADPYADGGAASIVHCDAVLANALVDGDRISALLDFEWARTGPRDLELVSLVRMSLGSPVPYLSWLAEDYPALFDAPGLDERLWLGELGYILRGVIWWPPDQPESRLIPEHHVHTLRRLVEAPFPR